MTPRPNVKKQVFSSIFDCLNATDGAVNNTIWNSASPLVHSLLNNRVYISVFRFQNIIDAIIEIEARNTVFEFMKAYEGIPYHT